MAKCIVYDTSSPEGGFDAYAQSSAFPAHEECGAIRGRAHKMFGQFLKIITVSILLIFIAAGALSAQGTARQTLDKLSSAVSALGAYKVTFQAEAEGHATDGRYVVSGNSYRMTVPDMEVISDGRIKYTVNHMDETVLIDTEDLSRQDILNNPTRAFQFAPDAYSISSAGFRVVSGKQCDVIELTPSDSSESYSKIRLFIERGNSLPLRIEYEAEGLSSPVSIDIKTISRATGADRESIRFDRSAYPGYELVDFR